MYKLIGVEYMTLYEDESLAFDLVRWHDDGGRDDPTDAANSFSSPDQSDELNDRVTIE